MNTSTVPARISFAESGHGALQQPGLTLAPETDFDTCLDYAQRLGRQVRILPWAVGDLARHVRQFYPGRWGEFVQATRLDDADLRAMELVAGSFEMSRRHPELTFQHHVQLSFSSIAEELGIAGSDFEQDDWLDRAEANGWDSRQLKLALAEEKPQAALEPGSVTVKISAPAELSERWIRAATREGLSLDEWAKPIATKALDEAADRQLETA